MIELRNATKLYRTVIGINDITLSLEAGAHGLLGPNGSGKTTFLRLVTGQMKCTQGSVRLFGENPFNNRRVLYRLGNCPADEAMYANVSGLEWVQYQMELHGFFPHYAHRISIEALERLGMTHAMHRTIKTYSRGMRQRTKLAQAMAHDPDLLILDEPFNGLDPVGRHDVTALLREWIARGKSLILASHILYEVEAISHSFMLLCGGRLLASGTAEEVNMLLDDIPSEMHIRCNRPRELAQRLISTALADRIRFEDDNRLVVASRNPGQLFRFLPDWIQDSDLQIDELRSSDDSLQSLFDALMKMHRGGEV